MTLEKFAAGTLRNAWLYEPGIQVYVRISARMLGGVRVRALDIANVAVDVDGIGTFTAFLGRAEALRGFDTVFVENVLNEKLAASLAKRGYSHTEDFGGTPSFYKSIVLPAKKPVP